MTAVIEEVNIDPLTLIDFELEAPCENADQCGGSAEWKFVRSCCGEQNLTCTECKVWVLDWLSRQKNVRCFVCDSISPVEKIFMTIEPV